MKKSLLGLTISTVVFSSAPYAYSQKKCEALFDDSISSEKPFVSFDDVKPKEMKDIESQISALESGITVRKSKKLRLEEEFRGKIYIPSYMKSDALKGEEQKLKDTRVSLEREERQLLIAKKDLEEAKQYLKNKSEKFGNWVLKAIKWEKKWTEEDVVRLQERIALYESIIPIRKGNMDIYKQRIAALESAIKEVELKKIKLELDEIIAKDENDQSQIQALNAKKYELSKRVRLKGIEVLKTAMNDSRLKDPIKDLMGYYAIRSLAKESKVTILAGNNFSKEIDPQQAKQLKDLVKGLAERRYHIVFDAESPYASMISQMAGDLGIPVMAKKQTEFSTHKNKVVISNDYLRMNILAESRAVISTPDSITGIGLYTEGLATHMLDSTGGFETGSLRKWVADLDDRGRNLGITTKLIETISSVDQLFEPSFFSFSSSSFDDVKNFRPYFAYTADNLNLQSIERLLKEAISYAKVMQQNEGSGGSVIFGSSKEDKHSANLIYQSAYKLGRLGIAVTTGGSGGAMQIANSGAWNSGGVSLGIPISGKHKLDSEKTFASSTHTKTIFTKGYEERIPALLESRKVIIFAPGGDGTIKELATTFVRAAGKFESFQKIIFLDSDYYESLVKWINNSSLPRALKDKIVLVDTAEDVEAIGRQLQDDLERNRISSPRKDQLTYEVKSKAYIFDFDSKDWLSMLGDKGRKDKDKAKDNNKNSTKNYSSQGTTTEPKEPVKPKKFKDEEEENQFYRDLYNKYK